MTNWKPLHGHVSQLEDWRDGRGLNGQNNCSEASIARYLREAGYPFAGTDSALIAQLRLRITGRAEVAGEPYTSEADVLKYLGATGLGVSLGTFSAQVAASTPWCLLLVRGVELFPRQYPPDWFGNIDAPDHFILSLPGGVYNDPLAYWNGQADCRYATIAAALRGGWAIQLKDPDQVSWRATGPGYYVAQAKAPPPPPQKRLAAVKVGPQGGHVRVRPTLSAPILTTLLAGALVPLSPDIPAGATDEDAGPWYQVRLPGGKTGFISHLAVASLGAVTA